MDILAGMCQHAPTKRVGSFSEIEKTVKNNQFPELDFTDEQLQAYRDFSGALCQHITKVENGAKYLTDIDKLRVQLNDAYQRFMLEEIVPDAAVVLRCFLTGMYYYRKTGPDVAIVREFLKLLRSMPDERAGVILANLHMRLDSLPRYANVKDDITDDDVPF
jgi:hypothetical protein